MLKGNTWIHVSVALSMDANTVELCTTGVQEDSICMTDYGMTNCEVQTDIVDTCTTDVQTDAVELCATAVQTKIFKNQVHKMS